MKRFPPLLGLAAALLMIVSASAVPVAARTSAATPVTIHMLYRIDQPIDEQFNKWLADTFNARNAGKIRVVINGVADNDYKPKITLILRGSNAPDIFFSWEGGWAKYMVDSGYSAPLDKYYSQYHWTTSLSPAASKLATLEGHKYFLPYFMAASVVWYNTALYKKYGLTVPKTWAQLAHNAAVLKSHGVAPFLLANQQQWEAQFDWTGYFVNKYGVALYNKLLNRQIPWTDKRVVATFAQMKTMESQGWFLRGVNSMDFDSTAIIFWKRQQAAMWYQGSFILSKFLTSNKLQYPVDWFPYPQIGSQKPTVSVFAESTYMINKKSKYKDQAAKFLNFLVSPQAQRYMLAHESPFAANRSVKPVGTPPMVQRLGNLISSYPNATFMHIDHALAPGVSQPYLEALQAVLAGTMTPAQAAQKTETAAIKTQGKVR